MSTPPATFDAVAEPVAPARPARSTGTSTAPTAAALWRRWRGPLAVLLVGLLVSGAVAALRATGSGGLLDPRSPRPEGSRALAQLLADRGGAVRVVGDLAELRDQSGSAGPDAPLVVPAPARLTDDELRALGRLDRPLLVVGADAQALAALDLPVQAQSAPAGVRAPACDLPAARTAGSALTGGTTYTAEDGGDGTGCYAAAGRPSLLVLPDERVTLLGDGQALTNAELDEQGNAALALGLLTAPDGTAGPVLWFVPAAGRAVPGERATLRDLLPDAVPLAALQVLLAVVLLALARGRRLGRVVAEPLPVVVRAAEAVEGRGRLYRAARARGTAGQALRDGAHDRLARRLSLPPDGDPAALVETVAARAGRPPADVGALLHGPPPPDDAALVRLAEQLDALVHDATR